MLTVFSLLVYMPCLFFFKRISTAKFNEKGALIDAGIDLNMESGFSEYIKDLIIITAACQSLALIWIYFWWLWISVCFKIFLELNGT